MQTPDEGPGSERDQARFYAKVALPNGQGCMLWLDERRPDGYASFSSNGFSWLAHRYSYELTYGPIPKGLVIDHVKARGCANKHCVAPLHLEAVTQAENMRRGLVFQSQPPPKTHCKRGHAFDEANTRVNRSGSRVCRACARIAARRRRQSCKPSRAA